MTGLSKVTFSGHETFTFRYPWLKKGVDAVKKAPTLFHQDDAIVELGVGKNMVASIRHWCLVAGMIEETGQTLDIADIGRRLLGDKGWDPYLEDDASLWLLHWQIVANAARATTWHFAFHHLREPEFTRESLAQELRRNTGNVKVSSGTLDKDVACFVRCRIWTTSRSGAGWR